MTGLKTPTLDVSSECIGDLFADASLSDSEFSFDDFSLDPVDPILPPSRQVTEIVTNPQLFVLTTVLTGISCTEGRCFTLNCRLWPVQEPEFYHLQREMLPKIVGHNGTVVAENRSKVCESACVAVDVSWIHRRPAPDHIVGFIECGTGLVVDLEIVTRDNHFHHGDYAGSPNGMET
jgi:hypothetical protein